MFCVLVFGISQLESLGMVGKRLHARNEWAFKTHVSVYTTTVVLPLSVWKIIAFSVASFCFICFMT